jgi:IS5 family transposase
VETNSHSPTGSALLGTGFECDPHHEEDHKTCGAGRNQAARPHGSVKFRLLEIGRIARAKGQINQDKLKQRYRLLLNTTSRVAGQAKRFSAEIGRGVKQATSVFKQVALEGLRAQLDEMAPLVRQVMKQTRARIFRGNTQRGQASEPVRTVDRSHSQRQGRQAQRVRQDGETAGGGEPDHRRLRGLRAAAK